MMGGKSTHSLPKLLPYGQVETEEETLEQLQAPVLGIFGGQDRGIPIESVNAFEARLQRLGKPHEIHVYPDADHAFCNPTGSRYQAKEALDAWNKTLNFLERKLRQ